MKMGLNFLDFKSVDKDFNDCVDGFILVEIEKIKAYKTKIYSIKSEIRFTFYYFFAVFSVIITNFVLVPSLCSPAVYFVTTGLHSSIHLFIS